MGSVDITSRAVSLPFGVPTAGAVFFMAGFLKVLIMCFPYSGGWLLPSVICSGAAQLAMPWISLWQVAWRKPCGCSESACTLWVAC